jgi:hypothetical protein
LSVWGRNWYRHVEFELRANQVGRPANFPRSKTKLPHRRYTGDFPSSCGGARESAIISRIDEEEIGQ